MTITFVFIDRRVHLVGPIMVDSMLCHRAICLFPAYELNVAVAAVCTFRRTQIARLLAFNAVVVVTVVFVFVVIA